MEGYIQSYISTCWKVVVWRLELKMGLDQNEKPGWGKTIGVFFLCGMLAIGTCFIVSGALVSGMGYSGYSTGGIMGTLTGVLCAAYYRSTGKLAGPVIVSVIAGAVIGYAAVQLAASAAGL